MSELELFEPGQLRVDVRVVRGVEARQVAAILTAVDRSFSRFAREEYGLRGVHFRVAYTGTGSWWAILTAVKELTDLARDYPDLVPIFAQNIELAFKSVTLMDQAPKDTANYARNLLRDLAKAGKRIGADAIELASDVKIVIESAYFESLEASLSERGYIAEDRESAPLANLPDHAMLRQAASLAQNSGLIGTVFQVAQNWYLRAEGMFGVLIPLSLGPEAEESAEHNKIFSVEGTLLTSPQGFPIGVEVKKMTALG